MSTQVSDWISRTSFSLTKTHMSHYFMATHNRRGRCMVASRWCLKSGVPSLCNARAVSGRYLRGLRSQEEGGGGGTNSKATLSPRERFYIKMGSGVSNFIVQELCESRGGRPGLSVLTSLLVSVDVKIYCTVLRHWSQLVPNMSHDI